MTIKLRATGLLPLLFLAGAAAAPDDALYSALLQDHVREGLVDYAALKKDGRLDTYLGQIAATDPAGLPNQRARVAFWINTYNGYTLKLVAEHYPTTSINDLASGGSSSATLKGESPWSIRFAKVGDQVYMLDEIENEVLRKEFKDPRFHFALVCAALSCPILRSEAYSVDRLDAQLDLQGRWFLYRRNFFQLETKHSALSKAFVWFADDFGASQSERLQFLATYAPREVATSLRSEPDKWKVSYAVYNWGLNALGTKP